MLHTPVKSRRTDLLRRKLDTLEQLLVQNQQENQKLRQQLKTLQAQRHQATFTSKSVSPQFASARRAQKVALKNPLHDLRKQQELYETQITQAEELFRNGNMSSQNLNKVRSERDINQINMHTLAQQLAQLS